MPKTLRQRNLPLLLLQARETVIARFRPLLTAHGLTEQQWRVIRLLDEHEALEPWQISASCQILKPSLTGVLRRLQHMGLVVRHRSRSDGRRQIVSNTAHARELIARLAPLIERRYAELAREVGQDAIEELYQALDRLLAAQAPGAAGDAPGSGCGGAAAG